jgi:hypothetical protein
MLGLSTACALPDLPGRVIFVCALVGTGRGSRCTNIFWNPKDKIGKRLAKV